MIPHTVGFFKIWAIFDFGDVGPEVHWSFLTVIRKDGDLKLETVYFELLHENVPSKINIFQYIVFEFEQSKVFL